MSPLPPSFSAQEVSDAANRIKPTFDRNTIAAWSSDSSAATIGGSNYLSRNTAISGSSLKGTMNSGTRRASAAR